MIRLLLIAFLLLLIFPVLASAAKVLSADNSHWSTARRDSTGIAPDPATTPEAVVQVYAARAFNWRGIFGVHSWIAVKPEGAERFTRYEVEGWGVSSGREAVRIGSYRPPDAYWFGNFPEMLVDIRGAEAAALIPQIVAAADSYPFKDRYTIWPGPNSNTFTAHVARNVPGLRLDLPPTAIGKDYRTDGIFGVAPSNTGLQLSLFGLAGVTLALQEGVEVNLLGLTLGIDFLTPAIKLPGIGRVGFPQGPS